MAVDIVAARARNHFRWRLWTRIGFASIAFVLMVASGYAWAVYQNFTAGVPHGAAVPTLQDGQQDLDGAAQNVLLIGNDSRAGASKAEQDALSTGHDDGTVNTDTMMILHIPDGGGKPSVISFPRDSWVSIPGHGKGKLNAAYGDGYYPAKNRKASEQDAQSAGIISTLQTLSQLTGLHIDHYLQVNLLGFYRISNAIGGVTVCLKHAQNATTDRDAYGSGYSGIDLPAGESTISGAQALAFVRQRHGLPHGDLDRIKRQQYFLGAAFSKVTSAGELLNPFKLHDLLDAVSSSLLTDPALNLLSLARSFEMLSAGDISFDTLPNNGPQVIYPDGVETAIVQVATAAVPGFIRSVIGRPADPALAKATAAKPSSVTVDILNGTDIYKLATRNATALKKLGFKIDVVDSTANPVAATTVLYPLHAQSAAKAVSAAVPGAKLVATPSVDRVTIQLGTDGKQVSGLTASTPAQRPSTPSGATSAGTHPGCID